MDKPHLPIGSSAIICWRSELVKAILIWREMKRDSDIESQKRVAQQFLHCWATQGGIKSDQWVVTLIVFIYSKEYGTGAYLPQVKLSFKTKEKC